MLRWEKLGHGKGLMGRKGWICRREKRTILGEVSQVLQQSRDGGLDLSRKDTCIATEIKEKGQDKCKCFLNLMERSCKMSSYNDSNFFFEVKENVFRVRREKRKWRFASYRSD